MSTKAEKRKRAAIDQAFANDLAAQLAYDRAMAWARSVPGTQYGSTMPTRRLSDEPALHT